MFLVASIYIIEDNLTHLKYIKKRLTNFIGEIDYIYQVKEVVNREGFYKKLSYKNILDNDVFFVDIQLNSYFNGIDLAKKIRLNNSRCFIIFLTAEESKGMEIINKNIEPFGYIIKNFNKNNNVDEQIDKIMRKIIYRITDQKDIIVLKNFNNNLLISFSEINYFSTVKGNRHNSYLQTYDTEYILSESFFNIKKNKFPNYYIDTLKSYIINTHQIKSIDRKLGKIIFKNNKELYLSSLLTSKISKKVSGNKN